MDLQSNGYLEMLCRYVRVSPGDILQSPSIIISIYRSLPFVLLAVLGISAEIRCRYNATAPPTVSYYTCTDLATNYDISIEKLLLLNPLLNPDCTSIYSVFYLFYLNAVDLVSENGTTMTSSFLLFQEGPRNRRSM
jgi:hypothetical protein